MNMLELRRKLHFRHHHPHHHIGQTTGRKKPESSPLLYNTRRSGSITLPLQIGRGTAFYADGTRSDDLLGGVSMYGLEVPVLVQSSPALEQVLAQVEQASRFFSNPDPDIRKRGADTFLDVRHNPLAVDFACFALSRGQDPFVLFQAFEAILDNLSSLPLHHTTQHVPSLFTLRDFLLQIILCRSAISAGGASAQVARIGKSSESSSQSWSEKSSWPAHVARRAYQTLAAVEKRAMGLHIDEQHRQAGSIDDAIQSHCTFIRNDVARLCAAVPGSVGQGFEEEHLMIRSNTKSCIGILGALLEEFGTTFTKMNSQNSSRGKVNRIDHTGLLPLQHRWCKALVQTYIIQELLSNNMQLLASNLPSEGHIENREVFYALIPLIARICAWNFVIDKPFAGLDGPLSVEDQTLLLKGDETAEDAAMMGEENDDDDSDEDRRRTIVSRALPTSHADFVAEQVLGRLHLAYKLIRDSLSANHRDADASARLIELRVCILHLVSFRLDARDAAAKDSIQASKQCQVACIQSIVAEESSGHRAHDGAFAQSLLFISQLFQSYITCGTHPLDLASSVNVSSLVESLASFTASTFAFAFEVRPDSDEEDDLVDLGDESVDNVLSAWRALLPHTYEGVLDSTLLQSIRRVIYASVVRPYIEQRLLNSGASMQSADETLSDLGQEATPDGEKYAEQLITLASLARESDLPACIAYMTELSKSPMIGELHHFYLAKESEVANLTHEHEQHLQCLFEQGHWYTLIAGHILADQSKGEVAVLDQQIAALPSSSQDQVCHLIDSLSLHLLAHLSTPTRHLQSPRLVETLLWFTARWVPVYLLAESTGATIGSHFSGQAGDLMLTKLLALLQGSVRVWNADADVVLQIAAVIKAFSVSEGVMRVLLGLDDFQTTIRILTEGLDALPAKTHGPLISAIVGCIYSSSTSHSAEVYFEYIKHAIESRLSSVIHQPNFASAHVSQRSDTIASLLNALDMLDGLASSAQPKSAMAVYDFISRFFDTLSGLVQLYKERSEVVIGIVRVYRTLIGALDLGFEVDPQVSSSLNAAVWALTEGINSRSLLGDSPEMALEDAVPFEGLCLVIELLTDLMLASESDAGESHAWIGPVSKKQTSDVCLQGFATITPMLGSDARSVLRVQRRFANLTNKLCISYPHRIIGVVVGNCNDETVGLFQACIAALTITLGFADSSLVIDSFAAIEKLSLASEKVLWMVPSDGSGLAATVSPPPAVFHLCSQAFTAILSTLLRDVLIDGIAPSLFDCHLIAIRALSHSLISERLGGVEMLQSHMQDFCRSTKLRPEHAQRHYMQMEPQEESKKREIMTTVVWQLIGLCLHRPSPSSQYNMQARQDDAHFLGEARKLAWEGTASIRAP